MRHNVKTLGSRGWRLAPWVSAINQELMEEFERVRAASVKKTPAVLRYIAISLIQKVDEASHFAHHIRLGGMEISPKITTRWIQ